MTVVSGPPAPVAGREAQVVAAAAGDKTAFSELYQEFAPKVYNLVLRSVRNAHVAEDVSQEVWVRAYQRLGELQEAAAFGTWLYRIASRACIDRARRHAAAPEAELPEQLSASVFDDPEAASVRHEHDRLLWQSLGALPARQHLALFLREVEDKNYKEIAAILGTTESAIETLLFRARRGVAEAFERLQTSSARCGQAKNTMAALIDGEGTHVQRRAVEAHVDECRSCRGELVLQRQGSAAYAALPLVPLPALLAGRVLHAATSASLGAGAASASSGSSLVARVLGLGAKVKFATAALTITGGITVATLALPADSPHNLVASAQQRAPAGASIAGHSSVAGQTDASANPAAHTTGVLSASVLDQLRQGTAITLRPLLGNLAPSIETPSLPAPLQQQLDALQQATQDLGAGPAAPLVAPPLDQLLTPPAVVQDTIGVTPPAIALPTALPTLPLPLP